MHVPTESARAYWLADEWSTFASIHEVGIKVEISDNGAIYHGGSKVINNEVIFNYSQAETFVAAPKDGYEIDQVTFRKEAVAVSDNSMTVGDGVKSGVLNVSFRLKKFDLNINTTGNGVLKVEETILPAQTNLYVDSASVVQFHLQPEAG